MIELSIDESIFILVARHARVCTAPRVSGVKMKYCRPSIRSLFDFPLQWILIRTTKIFLALLFLSEVIW